MNSAPHIRSPWTQQELNQRHEHTLEFDIGIIEELEQWRSQSPEVIEDEVTHAHVADMIRLQQLAVRTREEVYHGSGVVRVSAPPLGGDARFQVLAAAYDLLSPGPAERRVKARPCLAFAETGASCRRARWKIWKGS